MVIDYWSRFGSSPLWSALSFAVSALFVPYAVAMFIHHRAVAGTRRSYLVSTLLRGLCLPLFAGFVFSLAMDIFTSHWFSALCDGYLSYAMLRDWNRLKNNDDWWTGRGTKLKRKLRSLVAGPSPVSAGAGA
ncbi:MAG TPA: hypothetical protein VF867_19645 [Arthrobacter sp.]